MKKIILMVFIAIVAISTTAKAQEINNSNVKVARAQLTDSILVKMDIVQFCKEFGIPSEYNKRYEAIIIPLCDAGIYLFNVKNNPYCKSSDENNIVNGRLESCYCYVGNSIQNDILKRNILKNRNLIKHGYLSPKDALRWITVK